MKLKTSQVGTIEACASKVELKKKKKKKPKERYK